MKVITKLKTGTTRHFKIGRLVGSFHRGSFETEMGNVSLDLVT